MMRSKRSWSTSASWMVSRQRLASSPPLRLHQTCSTGTTMMTTRQLVRSNPPTDRRREKSPGHFPPRGGYGHDLVAWKVSDPHRSAAERARMWELVKEVALALALPPSEIEPAQMVTDIEGGVEKPRPGRIVARQVPPRFAPYGWLDKVWDRGAALSGETVERSAPPPPTTPRARLNGSTPHGPGPARAHSRPWRGTWRRSARPPRRRPRHQRRGRRRRGLRCNR